MSSTVWSARPDASGATTAKTTTRASATRLIAGDHTIATDACARHLMGHDPQSDWLTPPFHRDRNSLLVAAEGGFGTVDLDEIDFESEVSAPVGDFFAELTDTRSATSAGGERRPSRHSTTRKPAEVLQEICRRVHPASGRRSALARSFRSPRRQPTQARRKQS